MIVGQTPAQLRGCTRIELAHLWTAAEAIHRERTKASK